MSLPQTNKRLYDPYSNQLPQEWEFTFPRLNSRKEQQDVFVIYQCDECGYPNLQKQKAHITEGGRVSWTETNEWIPQNPIGHDYVDVPAKVDSAASEAHECYSIGAYRSAVIMARSVLEGIANSKITPVKNNGYEKDLKEKIKDLAKEDFISKRLEQKASVIKDIGNGSTHNIFEEITETDAINTLNFLDLLINEIYTQEAQLNQLGLTNKKLETSKQNLLGRSKKHK